MAGLLENRKARDCCWVAECLGDYMAGLSDNWEAGGGWGLLLLGGWMAGHLNGWAAEWLGD